MKQKLFMAMATAILAVPVAATQYDPNIPTPQSVLGYELGDWVTDYHGMETYLSALAESSAKVEFGSYGQDYEHRQLRYAIVSSPSNIQNLESIRKSIVRLTDPRKLDDAATTKLIDETPLVIWLNYSTDGNETAGLESALMMAHHLAAAQDEAISALLEETVVILTPIMNPSSHERWTSWSNSFAARGGNADPQAMEHNPPWGVSTNNNHYLVDVNREALWATQRESAALRDFYYRWNPLIFVDHHGEYDNFAGPGYEEPLNPFFTETQRHWLNRMGQVIGQRFGEKSWSYWPWETGTFYPGFWESIGLVNGAIGFTYETIGGGSRGLRYRREDGSVITLKLAAEQHFEASLAVIETAVSARRQMLQEFVDYFRSGSTLDQSVPEKAFIVDPSRDPGLAHAVVEVLLANQVEVFRSDQEIAARQVHDYFGNNWQSTTIPAGAYIVPVSQPRARLLLTLMRKDLGLPQVTLEAAEKFRQNQESAGYYNSKVGRTTYLFYDVTAWSMPLTYGVPAMWTEQPLSSRLEPVTELRMTSASSPTQPARYGYLIPGDSLSSAGLLADLLQQDLVVNVAYSEFTIAGRSFPRGSLLVRIERNPNADLLEILSEAAKTHNVDVVGVNSPHAASGPSLGSDQFVLVKRPKIAVLAGDPVSVRSFGDLWFILEQLYDLEFTAIYKEQLDAVSLDTYDVLVMPHGGYGRDFLTADLTEALENWIKRGGTLVCLKGAASWVAEPEGGISSARFRPTQWPLEGGEAVEPRPTLGIPGAILRVSADPHHYLTIGFDPQAAVLVRSNLAFQPDSDLPAPFSFPTDEPIRLAGFAYEDSVERLAGTPYVLVEPFGAGKMVLFLEDPNFRVYWFGLHRLFLNSLLLAPSF